MAKRLIPFNLTMGLITGCHGEPFEPLAKCRGLRQIQTDKES
jgi:hypothetical protein